MKFEFIGNASGIFHGDNGTKLLCDPWINNGVFDGSWCHYPPLKTTMEGLINDVSSGDIDALYISHIHPDHYDDRYFNFPKNVPIIVLDHKFNFLIKNLERAGFTKIIRVKNNETIIFNEFEITLYAPFAKHNFHDSRLGNLIDSALVVKSGNTTALNANDNTPTVEACRKLKDKFKKIDLAMINYNAAGPYPSCFDNLNESEKIAEHNKVLLRNYDYMVSLVNELNPSYVLPFAGAYVLGGRLFSKNKYLGTSTWDKCKKYIEQKIVSGSEVICLRERDVFDLASGKPNKEYVKIDENHMNEYIEKEISQLQYPYEKDSFPDGEVLLKDIQIAIDSMRERMGRLNIVLETAIFLDIDGKYIQIYPHNSSQKTSQKLTCKLDIRLLRRILDRKSHWNNAEIGCHIDFIRRPNIYEFDAHTALQFFHI